MSGISKLRTLTNKKTPFVTRAGILSVAMGAALGFALAATSAVAQDASASTASGVTVTPQGYYAPSPAGLLPVVIVSQSRLVHYEDLDLRTQDGADTLRNRIYAAARMICNRLSFQYPASYQGASGGSAPDPDCYRGAIDRALPRAEAAITDARVGYGGH